MTARETRDYQRAQVALRALTYRDVAILWRSLDLTRLDDSFPRFAGAALLMVAQRREVSASLARAYIAKLRAGVEGKAPAIPTPPIPTTDVLASLRFKSVISIKIAMSKGTPLDMASKNALVRTMGVVDKHIGDAGRDLILQSVKADPAASGWTRRALGTCDFCELLAGVTNGEGEGFPRHDHCGCQPEPVYNGATKTAAWETIPRDVLLARADGSPLAAKAIAKIEAAFSVGRHTVTLEVALTPERTAALLADIDDVLRKAGSALDGESVTFHVPRGDPHFRGNKLTGGYVRQGESTVYLNPMTVDGTAEDLVKNMTLSGQLMPVVDEVGFRKYTLTHELGHVIDHTHTHTMPHVHDHNGRLITSRVSDDAKALAKDGRADLSKYGRSNVSESYAEAFAQWTLGGPGSSPVADSYAARYGWK